ncbi:MAG: hypothetical protein IH596_02290 [Bacteroidales bacterium]|nr:hypothetical protein [Bacteroidales bacterium]
MKYLPNLIPALFLVFGLTAEAQNPAEPIEGTVSYVTSQNVYVKFESTESIKPGDTLYLKIGEKLVPALEVTNLSSISCVCKLFANQQIAVSTPIFYLPKMTAPPIPPPVLFDEPVQPLQPLQPDTLDQPVQPDQPDKPVQDLYGFASIAAFSDFSNTGAPSSLKMKYTLSLNMKNVGRSRLSWESYMTFAHSDQNWSDIQNNLFNGLKIYNLSVNYEFNKHFTLFLGRKINPRISNMGAVDGLQFEMRFKPITIGILGGSRPDYSNYGFDFSLLQFGAYVAHDQQTKNGFLQTTLAFVQQMNGGNVDRRFAYLQHTNSVVKNLTFFGSVEVDFYQLVRSATDTTSNPDSLIKENSPKLSNLYLSLRYRILKRLSIAFSFNARKNVIYYETYKTFLEKLLDSETLQGYQLQINYSPVKRLSIGATGAYRFMPQDPRPTKNLYAYVTYSQIPGVNLGATGSFIILESSYLSGKIYGIGISKDFFSGKFYTGLTYRFVDYTYLNSGETLAQNVAEVSMTWRIIRKLAFTLYYEGTFEKVNQFNRIYGQLNFRF